MKKSLVFILSALCPFFFNVSVSNSLGSNEKEGQPRPVVIVINLPGTPQRPCPPPNSPKPTRLFLSADSNI